VFMNVSLRSSTFSADNLGIWASALCVVHCVVTPVLVSMSVLLARLIPGEERTHRALAMGIAALGAIALVHGFRTHGKLRVLGLMALGLGFIFAGAFFVAWLPSHKYEVAVTMTGSALMISAHRMNHTFCRDCKRCSHSDAGVC
jgi:MerC mercury resistance protein